MIKHLFRTYFKQIIFCGFNIISVLNEKYNDFKIFESFSFIELNTHGGYVHYYCMNKAIEFNSNMKGYLLMSDDVLLKYWKLNAFDINKVWFPAKLECTLELGNNTGWRWGYADCGAAYANIFNYFKGIQNGSVHLNEKEHEYFRSYMTTLDLNSIKTKNSNLPKICFTMTPELGYTGGDIFYVPKSKFMVFHFMCSIFRKFNLFLELAVPGILSGLDLHSRIQILNGKYNFDYSGDRSLDFSSYDTIGYFYHPFKYGAYTNSSKGKQFCNIYVQEKLDLAL